MLIGTCINAKIASMAVVGNALMNARQLKALGALLSRELADSSTGRGAGKAVAVAKMKAQ